MKKTTLILALFFTFCNGYSQKIHTNTEIIQLMTTSKLNYEVKKLEKPIESKDYSDILNYHDCYRVVTDSDIVTKKFSVNAKAKPYFDKAEVFFQSQTLDSALLYYKSALDADSSLIQVMTYIGQIYEKKGDYENSVNWYKKSIRNNYIDYMAHWFLADIYLEAKELKKAVDEIVIARILNRNNTRIAQSMDNIFEKAKRSSEDWYFNPQIDINKISETKVSIALDEKWRAYAMAKALWMFEPGYSKSMGVPEDEYSTLEDQECLSALLEGMETSKIDITSDPQLRILKAANKNHQLDSYILYEIVLPQTPYAAYELPEKTILEIKDYILDSRNNAN